MSVRTARGGVDVTSRQPRPHQAVDDVLSQARAQAVKEFLEQDVDAWLAFYEEQGSSKWGSREERWMITSRGLVSDAAYDGAKASGRIAPGYPFVVEAPEDVPDGSHLQPDRPIGKPKRPAS